jgi:hypothetical protein
MKLKQATCMGCGEIFATYRVDKQFCSGRCKSRYFRERQKEKLDLLERLVGKLQPDKRDLFAA